MNSNTDNDIPIYSPEYSGKLVKRATIEVIKPSRLKVGDEILWANWRRKVVNIDTFARKILVTFPLGPEIEELPMYCNFYKIISCEEYEYKAYEENELDIDYSEYER